MEMTELEHELHEAKAAWGEAQKRVADLKPLLAKAKDDVLERKRNYEVLHEQVHRREVKAGVRYYLRLRHIGPAPVLNLERAEFEAIALSRRRLNAALGLEENFELLIRNYVEWEDELDAIAAAGISALEDALANFELRERPNRRLVNVLTAALVYVDHAKQLVKQIVDRSETAQCALEQRLATHFDGVLAYRFFSALRNYVQHNGLAVHKLSLGVTRGSRETTVEPFTVLGYLEESDSFSPRSLLKKLPLEVDLRAWLKQYLRCLADVHSYVRETVRPNVESAWKILQRYSASYAAVNGGDTFALAAVEAPEGGAERAVFLQLSWDDVRSHLTARAPDQAIRP